MSASTSILFVGDMHLGTRPSRRPASVTDPDSIGPAGAWERTVQAAIDHEVAAVALAGDVVNRDNALFEARGALDRGLARLAAAGIPALAVAGNHDTASLPAVAALDERLILLGAGGAWQAHEVRSAGGPPVRIVGWSFPRPHWESSPLDDPPPPPEPGVTTFGLLHGDLDGRDSVYAPVAASALRAVGYDAWMLGHVHAPGEPVADGGAFYLGSLSPLDPSETGIHGPLLVSVAADGAKRMQRLPLAPMRWEHWDLPCDDSATPEGLTRFLLAAIEQRLPFVAAEPGTVLGLRLRLAGEVAEPVALADAVDALALADLEAPLAGVTVFVDRLTCEATGVRDLAALARGNDPAALLARRILALSAGGEAAADTLDAARSAAAEFDAWPQCRHLGRAATEQELRAATLKAAHRLLDRMLAGRDGAP